MFVSQVLKVATYWLHSVCKTGKIHILLFSCAQLYTRWPMSLPVLLRCPGQHPEPNRLGLFLLCLEDGGMPVILVPFLFPTIPWSDLAFGAEQLQRGRQRGRCHHNWYWWWKKNFGDPEGTSLIPLFLFLSLHKDLAAFLLILNPGALSLCLNGLQSFTLSSKEKTHFHNQNVSRTFSFVYWISENKADKLLWLAKLSFHFNFCKRLFFPLHQMVIS